MSTPPNPLLEGAKAALAGAEKKFPTSMAKAAGAMPAKPASSLRVAMPKKDMSKPGGEIADIGSGLAWKKQQVDAAATKYHKGGKVKEDGVQLEKGETVLPNKGKKKVMELAMKHLDGMKDGMEAGKKKSAKSEKKSESKKKKVHPFKRTEIEHHGDGSHTMRHFHDTDATQDMSAGHPDDGSMMSALQGAMSQPQTLAGASAALAPEAPAAGMPS